MGRDDDDVLVIRATSRQLNPTLDEADIARRIANDPAAARAEWLAEWRDDINGWLPLETIEAAVDRGVSVRPPLANRRMHYAAAIDPSGGAKDSFTAAVAHVEDGVAILDCVVEIKPPFNPTSATARIAGVLKSYGLSSAVGDRYAAEWVVEAFKQNGIRYQHSERDRSRIYLDAMPLLTSGRARLLDNPRLVTQFAGLERRTSAMARLVDRDGGHDDLCNSAALALVLAVTKRKPMIITDEVLRATRRQAMGQQPASLLLRREKRKCVTARNQPANSSGFGRAGRRIFGASRGPLINSAGGVSDPDLQGIVAWARQNLSDEERAVLTRALGGARAQDEPDHTVNRRADLEATRDRLRSQGPRQPEVSTQARQSREWTPSRRS